MFDFGQPIWTLRDLSEHQWGAFVIVNCLALFFVVVIVPRLHKYLREARLAREEIRRRLDEYYHAMAGPGIFARNLGPQLSIGLWAYIAIMAAWALINPTVPLCCFGLSVATALLWQRKAVEKAVRKLMPKFGNRAAMPDADIPASVTKE